LARLVEWKGGKFTENAGFYLIGFFEIQEVFRVMLTLALLGERVLQEIRNNVHIRRGIYDGFYVFKGSKNSARFEKAIPFDKEFADEVMRDKQGRRLEWSDNKTPLQTIGSYSRTCRMIEDGSSVNRFMSLLRASINSSLTHVLEEGQ